MNKKNANYYANNSEEFKSLVERKFNFLVTKYGFEYQKNNEYTNPSFVKYPFGISPAVDRMYVRIPCGIRGDARAELKQEGLLFWATAKELGTCLGGKDYSVEDIPLDDPDYVEKEIDLNIEIIEQYLQPFLTGDAKELFIQHAKCLRSQRSG